MDLLQRVSTKKQLNDNKEEIQQNIRKILWNINYSNDKQKINKIENNDLNWDLVHINVPLQNSKLTLIWLYFS